MSVSVLFGRRISHTHTHELRSGLLLISLGFWEEEEKCEVRLGEFGEANKQSKFRGRFFLPSPAFWRAVLARYEMLILAIFYARKS